MMVVLGVSCVSDGVWIRLGGLCCSVFEFRLMAVDCALRFVVGLV